MFELFFPFFFCAVFYNKLITNKKKSILFSEIIIFAEQKQPFFMAKRKTGGGLVCAENSRGCDNADFSSLIYDGKSRECDKTIAQNFF